jgi:hypothetical protein
MVWDLLVKDQFWPHLLLQMFQNFEIIVLVNSMTMWDKLFMQNPFAAKEINQNSPDFLFLHLHFLTE